MKGGKEHIALCYLTMDHQICLGLKLLGEMAERMNFDPKCPWRFKQMHINNCAPTERARNVMTAKVLADPSIDRMVFFDADVYPPTRWTDMLKIDADIAAACYPIFQVKQQGPGAVPVKLQLSVYRLDAHGSMETVVQATDEAGIIEIDAAGTGAMCIRRAVLEDDRMTLPGGNDSEGIRPVWRWVYESTGRVTRTDDIDFCQRAKALGYSIKADTRVVFGHLKMTDLSLVLSLMNQSFEWGYKEASEPHDPQLVGPSGELLTVN